MTHRATVVLVAISTVLVALCAAIGVAADADPMIAVELISAVVFGAWSARTLLGSWRGHRMRGALRALAEPAQRFGVSYERLPRGGRRAFALGLLRPTIFLGAELAGELSAAELRGVLLHEEHHRRTRAPLRGIALAAWLNVLGRQRFVRRAVERRLVDLERAADEHALAQGVSRTALASALLKTEHVAMPAASFREADGARVRALLDTELRQPGLSLPLEWAPPVVVVGALFICHALGLFAIL